MLVVGLTGGIGSGKTTVSDMFANLGVDIVDTDRVARDVVAIGSQALSDIQQHFGETMLSGDGSLDRRKLREIIFSNPAEKQWLEQRLHPEIKALTQQRLTEASSTYAILSSPLLIESEDRDRVNRILVVDAPVTAQLERTAQRDKTQLEAVQKIIDSQIPPEKRLAFADDIIDNSTDINHLKQQVNDLHKTYLALAKQVKYEYEKPEN